MKITDKDWTRMLDLVLTGKDGAGTAKVIKDKNKAIARYVAGLKLKNSPLNAPLPAWKTFCGQFAAFGNRALELGATIDEIKDTYCENPVPGVFLQKMESMAGKKLQNRFVGDLSKKVLNAGFDINYLRTNGNAISRIGKDAMARNGRKWTIGYRAEIDLGSRKANLVFDAITDEGDGPTSYVIVAEESDNLFKGFSSWVALGKLNFIYSVLKKLTTI